MSKNTLLNLIKDLRMFSFNSLNVAIATALSIVTSMPLANEGYSEKITVQTVLSEESLPINLREAIMVANALLNVFNELLYKESLVFNGVKKEDFTKLFESSDKMVSMIKYSPSKEDKKLLSDFENSISRTKELVKYLEYKEIADTTLLSRVNDTATTVITSGKTHSEIEKLLFG